MPNYHENLEAEQIRQQMSYVRQELNDDLEQVVEDANSLGDLRAYIKAQPIGWLIAAAVAGFVVVPAKKESTADSTFARFESSADRPAEVKKSSMLGAALGMATTVGTRLIISQLTKTGLGFLEQNASGRQPEQAYQQAAGTIN